jgi:hypothetical protein
MECGRVIDSNNTQEEGQSDYKEKDSSEFKGAGSLYPAGYYNYEMEGVNFD